MSYKEAPPRLKTLDKADRIFKIMFGGLSGEYSKIIKLLNKNNLDYCLIKFHLSSPQPTNDIDILLDDSGFRAARKIFLKEGFVEFRTEFQEKYKSLMKRYIPKKGFVTVHLHRELSWGGAIVLDKGEILRLKKRAYFFYIPSPEHEAVIYIGHNIFENHYSQKREIRIMREKISKGLNLEIIKKDLEKYGWFFVFNHFRRNIHNEKKINHQNYLIFKARLCNFCKCPRNIMGYLLGRFSWLKRVLSVRRKGALICLSGANSSARSTLAKEITNILVNAGVDVENIRYGKSSYPKCLFRYLFRIYPKLRTKTVICDQGSGRCCLRPDFEFDLTEIKSADEIMAKIWRHVLNKMKW